MVDKITNRMYEEITRLIYKEQYNEALLKINELLKSHPDDFPLIRLKIRALANQKQYTLALSSCDKWLKDFTNDTDLYLKIVKLKVNVLCKCKQYHMAMILCDELLNKFVNNIYLLNIKARIYYDTNNYKECIFICKTILKLDPKNYEAKSTLDGAKILKPSKYNFDFILTFFDFLEKHLVVTFFIILFILYYIHPTKEVMTCDANYKCTVKQEFANIIKTKKEIQLSPQSIISIKGYHIPGTWRCPSGIRLIYVLFDKKSPFIMYYVSKKGHSSNNINRSIYINFYAYIKEPSKGFEISSEASTNYCYMGILIFLIFFIAYVYEMKNR